MKIEDQEWAINPNTGNKINIKKVLTDIRLASVYIDGKFPFFSTLLKNLKIILSFQVPTACTDGTRLIYNPEFMDKLSIRMKAFVLMHEIMHCSVDHMVRGKGHPHKRSNDAADYEVNGLLCADGIVSESDLAPYLFDHKYDGMSYEHIYSLNPPSSKSQDPQMGGQEGSGGDGDGGSGDGEGNRGGGSQDNTPKSAEWIKGWNQALEDYKNGKIKL